MKRTAAKKGRSGAMRKKARKGREARVEPAASRKLVRGKTDVPRKSKKSEVSAPYDPRLSKPAQHPLQAQLTGASSAFGVYEPKSRYFTQEIAAELRDKSAIATARSKGHIVQRLVAKEPFGPGRKSIVCICSNGECTGGITTLDASQCNFVGRPSDFGWRDDLMAAVLKLTDRKNKPLIKFGGDFFATVNYVAAGGEIGAKSTEFDNIDLQILGHRALDEITMPTASRST